MAAGPGSATAQQQTADRMVGFSAAVIFPNASLFAGSRECSMGTFVHDVVEAPQPGGDECRNNCGGGEACADLGVGKLCLTPT